MGQKFMLLLDMSFNHFRALADRPGALRSSQKQMPDEKG
jgi:hypothetical protein